MLERLRKNSRTRPGAAGPRPLPSDDRHGGGSLDEIEKTRRDVMLARLESVERGGAVGSAPEDMSDNNADLETVEETGTSSATETAEENGPGRFDLARKIMAAGREQDGDREAEAKVDTESRPEAAAATVHRERVAAGSEDAQRPEGSVAAAERGEGVVPEPRSAEEGLDAFDEQLLTEIMANIVRADIAAHQRRHS